MPASTPPRPSAEPADGGRLSARDRAILAMEQRTFRRVGVKERRIRQELGMSPLAYYVRLNALLDDPDALRLAPSVVNRLRARRVSVDPAHRTGDDRVA